MAVLLSRSEGGDRRGERRGVDGGWGGVGVGVPGWVGKGTGVGWVEEEWAGAAGAVWLGALLGAAPGEGWATRGGCCPRRGTSRAMQQQQQQREEVAAQRAFYQHTCDDEGQLLQLAQLLQPLPLGVPHLQAEWVAGGRREHFKALDGAAAAEGDGV